MTNTPALMILLTNSTPQELSLVSSKVTGSSSASSIDLPKTIDRGTNGGLSLPGSTTPYSVEWTYTPDNGSTLLKFITSLSGATGLTINPSETGSGASSWQLGESPEITNDGWIIRYYYSLKS